MAWAVPEHKPEEVNGAGKALQKMEFPVVTSEGFKALAVINNWRSAHAYPLNTFQITLRHRARRIERKVIIAQRAKRLDSIHRKLVGKPTMRMTQMQDIAGCRAVFSRLPQVYKLVQAYKTGQFDHKFRNEKDYILHPKADGYRSFHLVYEYVGTVATKAYNGLRVEVQIRTQYQHAWATAVEAVGIFTRQALKSNQGDQDWLRFFALMSSAIAAMEGTPCVPGTPSRKLELVNELIALANKLRARDMLRAYNTTLDTLGSAKDAKYFIVNLDPDAGRVTVRRYKAKESAEANAQYTQLESQIPDDSRMQVVLVSVADISALKRAYPNYFLDTALFARLVDRIIKGDFPDPIPHLAIPDAT
ncbi:RelA/SpoT domain-containing protein [Sphingobium chlorophenolicum]|uniref:GTP pyrophosphokinase YwaC n=1 Tax=Sphingobium chlorophenolicum TaxID=46429 RepID=A0A081RES8_SPHCR|nr:RelA/SpoT domain-containing protein [Sphingobium chlorophenolicum]KEQ53701.1 GTP pyrophosphokinase YwaC [Sphingobium chlorophenolicum]